MNKYPKLKTFLKEYHDLTGLSVREALQKLRADVWYEDELEPIFSAIAWVIEIEIKTLVISIQQSVYRDIYYAFGTANGIPLFIGTGKLPLFKYLSLSEIEDFLNKIVKTAVKNYTILEVENGRKKDTTCSIR